MSSLMSSFQYLVDMAQKHPDTLLNLDIASTSEWLETLFWFFLFTFLGGGVLRKLSYHVNWKQNYKKTR